MKKAILVLLSSIVTMLPAFARAEGEGDNQEHDHQPNDKTGITLLAGIVSYDSYIGATLEIDAESDRVFKFSADYTFSQGVILGLDATGLKTLESGKAFGTANVFTGYEFDGGIRLKAGLGCIIIDDQAAAEISSEAGYTLGLGYAFDNDLIIETGYTHISFKGQKYANTAIAVGYKF